MTLPQNTLHQTMRLALDKPDFIIVGAGSSGCVVARTLLEQGLRIGLIEAGPRLPVNRRPAEYLSLFGGPQDWSFSTVPQTALAGRKIAVPRGRGPGGSTRINATIWYPPPDDDWQTLHTAGGDDWTPAALQQALQRIERWVEPEPSRWLSTTTQRVLEVCQACDLAMYPYRRMSRQGKRRTAFDLLQPALGDDRSSNQSPLALIQATVRRVCIESGRAVGVEIETAAGEVQTVTAARGVILCGGAIASPQLLFASGIGDRMELRECGLDCLVDRPEVGKQLADHLIMPVIYSSRCARFPSGATVGDLARWEYLGTGPLASNLAEAGGLFTTSCGVRCQLHITPTHYLLHPSDRSPAALSLGVNVCQPQSRGRLTWRRVLETNQVQTSIDPAYCSSDADREALLAAIRWVRQLGQHLQADGLAKEELIPGERRKRTEGDDAIADGKSIARFAQTLYHPTGTCRMGRDADAVVDPHLAVRGIEGLSIIDASVLPAISSVNPNAMLMAMAHHAAVIIAGQ